ncbi:MAG: AAA family ATPase [Patescibacteria group bacterium]|nr:AAA family ATPase [Patescibacteria group bacterium]
MIIGITGTLGAGKGTVVEYLKKKGYKHYSVREFLLKQIRKLGLPENRDSMVMVANDLRKKYSPSYIAEELYKEAEKADGNCVIESLRAPREVEALKNKDRFYLLAVDAELKIRFERIKKRNSETDAVNFEEFVENEQREMNSTDPTKPNISRCMTMADFVIDNNGSFDELYAKIDEILEKICV